MLGVNCLTVLLILISNKVVDKIILCGTPFTCLFISDRVDPMNTQKVLSVRKLFINSGSLPFSPISL